MCVLYIIYSDENNINKITQGDFFSFQNKARHLRPCQSGKGWGGDMEISAFKITY